jgi:hypothetical protein
MSALGYLLVGSLGGGITLVAYFAIKAYFAKDEAKNAAVDAATERGSEAVLREQLAQAIRQREQLSTDLAAMNERNTKLEALYAAATTGAPPGPGSRDDFVRAGQDLSDAVSGARRPAPSVPVDPTPNTIGDGLLDPF